jgi:ATP-dependent Clp protease ATP-binding subunit ClpA
MFDRFTERARQVAVLAQEEARRLNSPHISIDHLVLGLLREEESLAAHALADLGLTLEGVRSCVQPGDQKNHTGQIPFTPGAKACLERALREALSLGHNYIGPEHILLAITGSRANLVLRLGVEPTDVRAKVCELLGVHQAIPTGMREHEWLLYRWENEKMEFVRRVFFKLPHGQQATAADVRRAIEEDNMLITAGRYRAIPADRYVDLTVTAQVTFA